MVPVTPTNFNFSDGFKILGGFKIFGLFSLAGTNDTWTFVWDGERQKWVLDFLGNDQFADMFTKTIGNSINYEGHEFKYPKLI